MRYSEDLYTKHTAKGTFALLHVLIIITPKDDNYKSLQTNKLIGFFA